MDYKRKIVDKIERLAKRINTERVSEEGGPVLMLGAGCSISSGCPSIQELLTINGKTHQSFEALFEEYGKKHINTLSSKFAASTPSQGYFFLSELIMKGYFKLILTTNFDTCLERAVSKFNNYDTSKVLVRGDVNDKRIVEILNYPSPRINIVKLHGCYISHNIVAEQIELWKIDSCLEDYLRNVFRKRGLIVIGYSMKEGRIFDTLGKFSEDEKERLWYIGKGPQDEWTVGNLNQIGFPEDNRICDNIGDFDMLFSELAFALGRLEFTDSKTDSLKDKFSKTIDAIENYSKIEIDKMSLKIQTRDLLERIVYDTNDLNRKNTIPWANNLVFVYDPDMPGGNEMLAFLKEDRSNLLRGKNLYTIKIKGRKEQDHGLTKRIAEDPIHENPEETPKSEDSIISDRYILLDSVSFTGNTIELCGQKLVAHFGKNIQIGIAVIFSSPILEKMVSNSGASTPHDEAEPINGRRKRFSFKIERFYRNQTLYTHQILFPWGLTSSTEDIFPTIRNFGSQKELDQYIPHKRFTFMHRPWGNMLSMIVNENASVKILKLDPREMTSKHRHYYRDEIFMVLDEHMIFQIWNDYILLRKGSTIRIPAGTTHRLIGLDTSCRILEIAENYYNQIEDIDRFKDKYENNRCEKKGDL